MKVPFKVNAKLLLPVLGIALGLNACSSGGGGGGGFNAPDIPDQPIAIDSSNEDQVAQAAFEGSNGGAGLGSPVSGVLGVQTDSNGNTQSVSPSIFTKVKTLFDHAVANNLQQTSNASTTGVQQSASDSCGYRDPFTNEQIGSGTESFRANVAAGFDSNGEPNSITAGDSVSISFSNCDYGDGQVQNGSMTLTFNSNVSLTELQSGNFDIDITFKFSNFSTKDINVDPPTTETLDGAMSIGLTSSGSSTSFDMSGSSLYAVLPDESVHLTNFSFKATTDGVNSTVEAKFTIASTTLDGQVTVDSYFEASGSGYPTSGYMNITGDSSELDVTVNGDGTVNVTLTVNGAVEAGYPKDVLWSDLGIEVNNAF